MEASDSNQTGLCFLLRPASWAQGSTWEFSLSFMELTPRSPAVWEIEPAKLQPCKNDSKATAHLVHSCCRTRRRIFHTEFGFHCHYWSASVGHRIQKGKKTKNPPWHLYLSNFRLLLFAKLLSYHSFFWWVLGRERLRCLVGFVEGKGFTYASYAKGIIPLNGRLCMTQLPSTPVFAQPAMEMG